MRLFLVADTHILGARHSLAWHCRLSVSSCCSFYGRLLRLYYFQSPPVAIFVVGACSVVFSFGSDPGVCVHASRKFTCHKSIQKGRRAHPTSLFLSLWRRYRSHMLWSQRATGPPIFMRKSLNQARHGRSLTDSWKKNGNTWGLCLFAVLICCLCASCCT